MPSPFPGMDPYLEDPQRWGAVHHGLIFAIQAQLNRTLPGDLTADIDEYVWITDEADEGRERLVQPDAFVSEADPGPHRRASGAAALLAGSVAVTLPPKLVRKHRYVKIVAADGRRVITVIEVLSPSNKNPGPDRDAYLSKRREYFAARANLVEVDLLRDGDRVPMGRPRPPVADYYVLVSPAADYPTARVWPFSVREPVPEVPVPIGPDLPPVALDLRTCLDVTYEAGAYDRKLDYTGSASPPLDRTDAEWAAALLKKHAKRKKK